MSGVWSRTSGCISPRIRISETKLLEAIKGLEAKTIIEVERRVARSNRYRICQDTEFDFPKAIRYICENQPDLVRVMVREMEDHISLLDDTDAGFLATLKQVISMHEAADAQLESPTRQVAATSPVRQRSTLPVGQHKKIPILLKLPNGKHASLKTRRSKLAVKPLPSKKQSSQR